MMRYYSVSCSWSSFQREGKRAGETKQRVRLLLGGFSRVMREEGSWVDLRPGTVMFASISRPASYYFACPSVCPGGVRSRAIQK
jgi:hypothetical protein